MKIKLQSMLKNSIYSNITLEPYVVLQDGTELNAQYDIEENTGAGLAVLKAQYAALFKDTLYFSCDDNEIICKRMFENISGDTINIKELALRIEGITFNGNTRDDYFYHNENPRIYEVMTFPVDYDRTQIGKQDSSFDIEAGNRWADPGVVSERIGASPYQPFPAILLSNYNTKKGLVHGTLSQKTFYHNYLVSHNDGCIELNVFSSFKAIDSLAMENKRILTDEWYFGNTEHSDNIEKIFEKYTSVLRKKLPVGYGRTGINRDNMVWGSWNDGILRNVSEELVLTEAKFLKENFPTVRWIQLDDGYAVYTKSAHGLGVPYEEESGIDKTKFPEGLRHLTDEIRKIGLRPALWVGGFCPKETKIYNEHPQWFCNYDLRNPYSAPLDVSQREVREYMKSALDTLIEENGFEGIKHDFWSYCFEDSKPLLKNKDMSGYEHRSWWLNEIRKRIAKDGYMQTGCDIVMGNPFLGEYFTNYRYGIDIGGGNWDYVKTTYLWGTACFALHTGDLFVPNSDSVGMLPGLSDNEAQFCINYCLVTHSMVEIAGLLSKAKHNERYKVLKKAVCNPNNGQDVYFVNYDYRSKKYSVPEIMYFKTPHFSIVENSDVMPVRTVGLFNLNDEAKTLSFDFSQLDIEEGKYTLTDVWSGEQCQLENKAEFVIEPHTSKLLALSKGSGIQLYDANIRINKASLDKNTLLLEIDYPMQDTELFLSQKVKNITLNGKDVVFSQETTKVLFDAIEKGELRIAF